VTAFVLSGDRRIAAAQAAANDSKIIDFKPVILAAFRFLPNHIA
jgi:hypothetical protein